ncbi:MAG: hypothetical protein ACR2N6_01115 [Miltoncostaeaceae bacterium]
MNRIDAVRLVAAIAQCEMALVRRDEAAGPLLAQAARAAHGHRGGEHLVTAARLVRGLDLSSREPDDAARRKVAQALCRAAGIEAQAAALAP